VPPPKPDALTQATRLLASTDKTRAQLVQALRRKGYPRVEIEQAISRAQGLGYLDDARLARKKAQVELRAGWAGEALHARLTATGLDEALARSAVDGAVEEAHWVALEAARALLTARKLTGAKAARFLSSRGFEEDVVERLVRLPQD
jgi:regulatory protein